MPVLRSQQQAELLTLLLLHPGAEYSITELSVKLGVPLTTVQREVNRFSEAGLITERRVGRTRVVSSNPVGRYTRPLTELLTLAFGPHVAIKEEFAGIPAVGIVIYGSWAARYRGVARLRRMSMSWSSGSRPGRRSTMPPSRPSSGSASQ